MGQLGLLSEIMTNSGCETYMNNTRWRRSGCGRWRCRRRRSTRLCGWTWDDGGGCRRRSSCPRPRWGTSSSTSSDSDPDPINSSDTWVLFKLWGPFLASRLRCQKFRWRHNWTFFRISFRGCKSLSRELFEADDSLSFFFFSFPQVRWTLWTKKLTAFDFF